MIIGLASIINDLVHVELWAVPSKQATKAVAEVLLSLLGLSVACLLVYGIIRAIGWVVGVSLRGERRKSCAERVSRLV
jgi:hypothetical protein